MTSVLAFLAAVAGIITMILRQTQAAKDAGIATALQKAIENSKTLAVEKNYAENLASAPSNKSDVLDRMRSTLEKQ